MRSEVHLDHTSLFWKHFIRALQVDFGGRKEDAMEEDPEQIEIHNLNEVDPQLAQ